MRTEDLKYFLAVAATGKLGPASDLAGISQPGLTKAVARLEAELGCALFQRTGRGMQLTEMGRAFEGRAQRMVAELNDAINEARVLHPLQGVLRIGVAPSIEPLLAPACARLMAQRPLLRVELMVLITDYLEIAVGSGRLDMAIATRLREYPEELSFVPVGGDEVCIAAPPAHALHMGGKPLVLADLAGHQWALPRRESGLRRHMDELFATHGLPRPEVRLENDFSVSAYSLAAQAGLLTICTPYVLAMLPAGRIVPLEIGDFRWHREIGVVTRRDAPASSLTQDLIGLLMQDAQLGAAPADLTPSAARAPAPR